MFTSPYDHIRCGAGAINAGGHRMLRFQHAGAHPTGDWAVRNARGISA
jgi:hypothetical protein